MQIGPMAASKLHLTPLRLPRLCAAAPARRLPLLLARAWGSEAAQGGRTRSPLIGRVAPLIMLFHPNWAEAERSGGSWEGPTGRRGRPRLPWELSSLDSAPPIRAAVRNSSVSQLRVARGRGGVILSPPRRSAETGRRHPSLSTRDHLQPTGRVRVKKGGATARSGERRGTPHKDWAALGAWGMETCGAGKEHSRRPATLREEVGCHWVLPSG